MQAEPITLAVLAGGQSTRMGAPKTELKVRGRPLLADLHARLRWPGPTLLVTGAHNSRPPGWDLFDEQVADPAPGGGPLQGLLTALRRARTRRLVLLALDLPQMQSEQLLELAGAAQAEGVLCTRRLGDQTLIEPFPSCFAIAIAPAIEERLAQNRRSLHRLLDLPQVQAFDASHWPGDVWTNLNTPGDLQRSGLAELRQCQPAAPDPNSPSDQAG